MDGQMALIGVERRADAWAAQTVGEMASTMATQWARRMDIMKVGQTVDTWACPRAV